MIFNKNKTKAETQGKGDKVTTGRLRLNTDLAEYNEDKIKGINISFNDPNNIMEMKITVEPAQESLYKGAIYTFNLTFPPTYPLDPPILQLENRVFHPQFLDGKVCLPLIRDDWKPTLTLYNVICGLLYLFDSPNPKDPLDKEAATLMNENLEEFKKALAGCLKGGSYKGQKYDRMIKWYMLDLIDRIL